MTCAQDSADSIQDEQMPASVASVAASEPGQTLAETLHRQLEHDILNGPLVPGTRLDEQEIAKRFGVSRTPVREAFRLLAAGGLVDLRSRQGATVTSVGIPQLLEMFQVMAELEGLCARLAARRVTRDGMTKLNALHDQLIASADDPDPATFYEVNRLFHEAIYEAAQNEFLAQQTRTLRNRVAAYRRQVTYRPGRIRGTLEEHNRILQAILQHDGEAAHSAMRDHINLLGDSLSDFIAGYS